MLLQLAIVAQVLHALVVGYALALLVDGLDVEGGSLNVLSLAVQQLHVERIEALVESRANPVEVHQLAALVLV